MKLYEGKTLSKTFGQIVKGKVSINMSEIYSILIKTAGRWCEHYASDILYDIKGIEDQIRSMNFPESTLIGFRSMGVDGNSMIKVRTKTETYNYLKILKLVFDKTEDNLTVQLIEMH